MLTMISTEIRKKSYTSLGTGSDLGEIFCNRRYCSDFLTWIRKHTGKSHFAMNDVWG